MKNSKKSTIENICKYSKEILNQDSKPSDNFFDLGGTSILAMKFHLLLKSKLSKKIPLNVIFKSKNFLDIAKYIENEKNSL